ncbi:MAG: flagellar hook-associated protein 3 [Ruminococcaceae bacterium]|nr:flagellar hook-associated protein 3 [Oscillospiraceae bacterium]
MRITMNMISKQYNTNLNSSLSDLNRAYQRGTDYRTFTKTSEDPFAASKAYRLRRESTENTTWQSLVEDTVDQFTTAESAMQSIYKNVVKEAGSGDCLQAINGTINKSNRQTIAAKLRQLQKELVAPCNTKYGDKYIFGGSDMTEPPFTVESGTNGTQLYYRGVNVNDGTLLNGETTNLNGALIQFGKSTDGTLNYSEFDGKKISIETVGTSGTFSVDTSAADTVVIKVPLDAGATNQQLYDELKNHFSGLTMSGDMNRPIKNGMTSDYAVTKQLSQDQLKDLANESSMIDIGMGLNFESDGTINGQSVFNAAIPGISFLGYGVASDGTSNNLYTLLGDIAQKLEDSAADEHAEILSSSEVEDIGKLINKFNDQGTKLLSNITEVGTKSDYLNTTKKNLESMGDAITEKDDRVEFMDPATAIMNFYMQQYSYNAALNMGTKILTKTLLDFMG